MSIKDRILNAFKQQAFTLRQAYSVNPSANPETVRARIYENLGVAFKKVGRGIYMTLDEECLVIEGNGRNLSALDNSSIDCIITDHPWEDPKSTSGGNRNFANYSTFKYTRADFDEKARVLKEGSFLCEILPAESESNFEYLYQLKQMAIKAGFQYYACVPWKKGSFVSNTGRKAKNTEDCMIFSKGKPRALRPDKQRGLDANGQPTRFMSGAAGMLPAMFDIQAVSRKNQIAQSEKPVALFEQLLEYLTLQDELVLDQFAGSGALGEACINKKRKAILIEYDKNKALNIANRLQASLLSDLYPSSTPIAVMAY